MVDVGSHRVAAASPVISDWKPDAIRVGPRRGDIAPSERAGEGGRKWGCVLLFNFYLDSPRWTGSWGDTAVT